MKFSLPFLAAALVPLISLVTTTQAAPLRDSLSGDVELVSRELSAREVPTDGFVDDLFARARKKTPSPAKHPLSPNQLSQRIQNVQKGQTARKEAQNKKASLNSRTTRHLKKPKTNDPKKMTANDKAAQKSIGEAIKAARNDKKAERAKKWESKKNSPAKAAQNKADKAQRRKDRKASGSPPPAAKTPGKKALAKKERKAITPQERKQVDNAFKGANNRKNKVQNLPGRKDTFTVGNNKFSGKDVRQGAFNAYLHQASPVGQANNKNPKPFGNRPYPASHPDASLRSKRPIPGAPKGLEHPIKASSHNGYTGSGSVGAGRVILHKDKQEKGKKAKTQVSVVGHDTSRGGDPSDHYLATHTKAKRDLLEDPEI